MMNKFRILGAGAGVNSEMDPQYGAASTVIAAVNIIATRARIPL
jgi:hypothetical protein